MAGLNVAASAAICLQVRSTCEVAATWTRSNSYCPSYGIIIFRDCYLFFLLHAKRAAVGPQDVRAAEATEAIAVPVQRLPLPRCYHHPTGNYK